MKSPKLLQQWSKKIGFPRWSISIFDGGIDEAFNSPSLVIKALTTFGNLSARLLNSHGSAIMSNKHGLVNGLHLLTGFLAQLTVALLRNFL